MLMLLTGLLLFLGAHSIHLLAPAWRTRMMARLGTGPWKGLYSLVSLAGFVLICFGYAAARQSPLVLWLPPLPLRHVAALLMLPALILLLATYLPRNGLRARLHHPMLLATKLWAFAHLLANGMLHDVLLFGSFLLWAIAAFAVARRRDRAAGRVYAPGTTRATVITVAAGAVVWGLFVAGLHALLFGVAPL